MLYSCIQPEEKQADNSGTIKNWLSSQKAHINENSSKLIIRNTIVLNGKMEEGYLDKELVSQILDNLEGLSIDQSLRSHDYNIVTSDTTIGNESLYITTNTAGKDNNAELRRLTVIHPEKERPFSTPLLVILSMVQDNNLYHQDDSYTLTTKEGFLTKIERLSKHDVAFSKETNFYQLVEIKKSK
ncbi:MAG: hypothetical protein M3Q97_10415 [Bacteroidota bacterium]|nr:hypothetical protein [Bacteroidota bacterium]